MKIFDINENWSVWFYEDEESSILSPFAPPLTTRIYLRDKDNKSLYSIYKFESNYNHMCRLNPELKDKLTMYYESPFHNLEHLKGLSNFVKLINL